MRSNPAALVKVVGLNLLVLLGLLVVPSLFFALYKGIKLSLEPKPPSQDLAINPAYPSPEEKEKAVLLGQDEEKGMTYRSFVGWRREPFHGNFKNVLAPYGVRRSINSSPNGSTWFFGGSTMWGTGAVDDETIPSWYAKQSGRPVFNLGESAWVSRQSLNQLLNLLGDGFRPERVVFYDGVNDVLHGCRAELKNVPAHLQEADIALRLKQSPFDPAIAAVTKPIGDFIVAPYKAIGGKLGFSIPKHQNYGGMDCLSNPSKAQKVADHLVANWYYAYLAAKSHGSDFLAVLQPQSFISSIKKDYLHESDLYMRSEYEAVYPLIVKKMKDACAVDADFCARLVDGTRWLDGARPVYIDFCHITGYGNSIIAEKILTVAPLRD